VKGREDIESIFLDLVELDKGTTADALHQALKKTLLTAGLDNESLKSHLISISTNGASVMNDCKVDKRHLFTERHSLSCTQATVELGHNACKSVIGCTVVYNQSKRKRQTALMLPLVLKSHC